MGSKICFYFNALVLSSLFIFESNAASVKNKVYFLQSGSYRFKEQALKNLYKTQKKMGVTGRVHQQTIQNTTYYQVQFGPYLQLGQAELARRNFKKIGYQGFIRNYAPNSYGYTPVKIKPTIKKSQRLLKAHTNSTPIVPQLPAQASKQLEPGLNPTWSLLNHPYNSRGIVEGTWGDLNSFFQGDQLYPLLPLNKGFGYIDVGGKYGEEGAWSTSLGAGVRNVFNNTILGGYVFGDYNRSIQNQDFWVVNPGIELITPQWDGVINGYIPASAKTKSLGIVPGFELGYESTHFYSHTMTEDYYNILEETGPGIDTEVGYTFNNFYKIRPFVGSYYFNPKESKDFVGVEGGIELPINNYFTLVLHDAYDKVQRNNFMGTLRVTLDRNLKSADEQVEKRLFDPIRRHLGAQQSGTGIPIINTNKFIGPRILDTNAWYFNTTGSAFTLANGFSNCTFENPCNVVSQQVITGINTLATRASFVINSGLYSNPLPGTGLTLFPGQKILGRTNNFRYTATGANRPLLDDTLSLPGFNSISNIQVQGHTVAGGIQSGVNILAGATGPVIINNSLISSQVNGVAVDAVGINSQNNTAPLTVANTEINAFISNSLANKAAGAVIKNAGPFAIESTSIFSSAINSNEIVGVDLENTIGNINNSFISSITNNNPVAAISAQSSIVNIEGTEIIAGAFNGTSTNDIAGIINSNSTININNSNLTVAASNYNVGGLLALNLGSGIYNISNSQITVNAANSADYVAGLNIGGTSGTANLINTTINMNLSNTGNPAFNYAINGDGNSIINLNGVKITANYVNPLGSIMIGLENGGVLTYQNTSISITGYTPSTLTTYSGPGSVTSLGNIQCSITKDGVTSPGNCPQ